MQVTIDGLEAYLQKLYGGKVTEQGLFMKLVEEMGEVAEALNKRTGRKASDGSDLRSELGEELADAIHYAVAIAAVCKADKCQIYTDVDGVYTADPRLVRGAKKHP